MFLGAINGLFERIEKRHGKVFVSRTLAYITAAKSGLTESELEDILSCDDDVLEDVFQYWVLFLLFCLLLSNFYHSKSIILIIL